jgi:UDP-glucose 4-epimerase
MTILVTGGLGYIGSHTVTEVINSGHNVVILDNLRNSKREVHQALEDLCGTSIPFYEADILDEQALDTIFTENDIQGIIHFAALKSVPESLAKPVSYFENNIKGVIHLMRAVERYNIPYFVFSSSCTVYGEPDQVPVTETTPTTRSITPYGNSKLISEMMLDEFTRLTPHVSTAILRYFNPVGAHPTARIGELPIGIPGNLMPFITQTAAGWREQLKVFGSDYDTRDGTAIRDYIHVVDLAIAHVKALEWLSTQKNVVDVFNLGTGNGCTVMEVIDSFQRTTGVALNYAMAPRREGDIEKIWAVTSKAEQVLGWKAARSLDDMTSSAWKWQQTLPNP